MINWTCPNCGASKDYSDLNGKRICGFCASEFLLQKDDLGIKSANISVKNDVEELLEKCRKYPKKAKRFANLILDIDPNNIEALKYL